MLKPFSNEQFRPVPEAENKTSKRPAVKAKHYSGSGKWVSGIEESNPETHKEREESSDQEE
jgi:hypothetical protein